ncbi:JAB domain-containing protein [Clostridium sp.]|uniref:JAB domain-containing protein n=1 Tax=Clostridium sp. TaxID=1506 RepID=UPI00306590C7
MSIFTKYKVELIKEKSSRYSIDRKIKGPEDVFKIAKEVLEIHKEPEEVLYVLALDIKSNVIGIHEVSRGSVSTSIVHPREIMKRLILNNAAKFILIHNHPSNEVEPSNEDKNVTDRLKDVGQIIGIELVDHVIIGDAYYSFKENNYDAIH